MPRKSVAKRLAQSENLLTEYTSAGLASSYQGRFISDVVSRLSNGRGLSKRQRDWIDNLIEEGVPTPKGDPIIIEKIDSAVTLWANNADRAWESNILADFKGRLIQGYDLSEKQTALFEKLLKRAEDDASGANLFSPNEEQRSDLEALVNLYKGYSPQWRNERPAVAKAVRRVESFLAGEGTIEVYHYDKLYKSMGAKLRKFKNPRFTEGSLGWIAVHNPVDRTTTKYPATALTDAYIAETGEIVNDWFVNSDVRTQTQDGVSKRR